MLNLGQSAHLYAEARLCKHFDPCFIFSYWLQDAWQTATHLHSDHQHKTCDPIMWEVFQPWGRCTEYQNYSHHTDCYSCQTSFTKHVRNISATNEENIMRHDSPVPHAQNIKGHIWFRIILDINPHYWLPVLDLLEACQTCTFTFGVFLVTVHLHLILPSVWFQFLVCPHRTCMIKKSVEVNVDGHMKQICITHNRKISH
jgi:hypothetical protein